jgi:Rrf2 family protein
MRISTKGDYGVRALIELAHHYGEGPLQSAEIAARQRIPEPYLDQLLTTLRKAGFIRSVRGPQGGHALIHRPEEVRLSDVIRTLEGSLSPVSHLHDEGYQCRAAHEVWHAVEEATQKILDDVTIGALATRELEYDRTGARYVI